MELCKDVFNIITKYVVAFNMGSTMKAWMFTCKSAYSSSIVYQAEISAMTNQPETMYKMGLITYEDMLNHCACPLKYISKISDKYNKYTFDNISKFEIVNTCINWADLSFKTNASIILANYKKPWLICHCAMNETFSFSDFEILMKRKKKYKVVIHFHTITSAIFEKYKKYFSAYLLNISINQATHHFGDNGYNIKFLMMEVLHDYPDIFHHKLANALLIHCKDFNLANCDNPQCVIDNAIRVDKTFKLYLLNHIWEYTLPSSPQIAYEILKNNPYVTMDVINNYSIFTNIQYNLILNKYEEFNDGINVDVLIYIMGCMNNHMTRSKIQTTLLNNNNLTWQDMHKYTLCTFTPPRCERIDSDSDNSG